MLKLNPAATFSVSVPLTVPGSSEPAVIDITFRHKGREAFKAWWESIPEKSDAAILAGIIADWSGPFDDSGNPVIYSESALAQLLDAYPAASQELLVAYRRELFESRVKN